MSSAVSGRGRNDLCDGWGWFHRRQFCSRLVLRNPRATLVIDKLTYAGNRQNLATVEGRNSLLFEQIDICSGEAIGGLLRQCRARAIVDFAAESHVDRSILDPAEFVRTNAAGTFSLLEACRLYWSELVGHAKDAFRFLHVSTDEVYGSLSPDDPAFVETTPYAPDSPYAASKAASDHLVRAYHQYLRLTTLTTNCSNNYGPFQFPEKLIPLMILNALESKPLPVYGDGENVRDWLYVGDHCFAIRAVLEGGRPGHVYNVGGNNEIQNIEVVKTICSLLDDVQAEEQRLLRRPDHVCQGSSGARSAICD